MIQMSSQVSDRYRPQHQHRHHQRQHQQQQQQQQQQRQQQPQSQSQQAQQQQQQQQNEFFNSNGNSNRTYSNDRNGSRYNGSNGNGGNKYVNKSAQANHKSISPPLSVGSVASSGSGSTNSGSKNSNNRNSKSYNNNGNTMQSMSTTHRNNTNGSVPTTPTIQQAYFPAQNIPFFHSTSPNGLQQIFSSAISPTSQTQQPHTNLSIGLYVQHNGTVAYHPNNNYHYQNRNEHGPKKNWQYNAKAKSKMNGNYSSSNSSTASSTNSSTGKSGSSSKSTPMQSRSDDTQPLLPSKPAKNSLKKSKSTDKMPVKKLVNKSTQVESPLPSSGPKIISLSDSETCNSKPKQHQQQQPIPPDQYFRIDKTKASSSPVINMSSASSPSLSSGNNPPNRTISHSFLSAIDNDTLKKSSILPDQRSVSYEKPPVNNLVGSSLLGFPHQRSAMQFDANALKSFCYRLRYMDPQNMHQFSELNARTNNLQGTNDCYNISPSRIKPNFASNVPQQKQRSRMSANPMTMNERNLFSDSPKIRETYYRARITEINIPNDLCNGTEWDKLSQKIWAKFEERRQPREVFEKKMSLWNNLCKAVETLFKGKKNLYLVGSTISGFALDTSDMDLCIGSRQSTNLDSRMEAMVVLNELRSHLQEHCQAFAQNLNFIPAKVPILRFDHPHSNIEVDLNYNNCVGIRNSHLLYCYKLLDWRLQPLAVMVKLWAQHHDINNAKDLTISSYSLILMVIHYLQCGVKPHILPCLHANYPDHFGKIHDVSRVEFMDAGSFLKPIETENKQTLGELFCGFLKYYSNFEFDRFAISVRAGRLITIEECRNFKCENDWKQLCIEEPFDRTNAARSCCDERIFERIKKIFTKSWHLLDETKDLDALFSDEMLVPPAYAYYDNSYSRIIYHPTDYIVR